MRAKLLTCVGLLLLISMATANSRRRKPPPDEEEEPLNEGIVEAYLENWSEARVEESEHGGKVLPHSTERERMKHIHPHLKEAGLSDTDIASLDSMIGEVDSKKGESGKRNKRAITGSQYSRWPFGIVPYMYTNEVGKGDQNEIRRSQLTYERLTCLRFVPWSNDDGVTPNERLNLGHSGYMRHVKGGGCWSVLGNVRSSSGQGISCCGGTNCIHEIGHALGMHHEQSSPDPDKSWIMRVNEENITPGGKSQYYKTSPSSSNNFVGYDITSYMHYATWMFNNGKGPTFTMLFPELKWHNSFYYLMMEASIAHECQTLNCSTSSLTCENDGYLTTVDDKCACRCVPGLDPDSGCRRTLSSQTSTQGFPGGSYALPEPKTGCPESSMMTTGTRVQYNDGGNTVSSRFDLKGEISGSKIEQRFCVVENSANEDIWPAGNYCIYRKGGTCPDNFNVGFVQYDDNSNGNNTATGDLPDGVYGDNTRFEYCCRDNGFYWEPIFLPNRKPFVLFKNGGTCQYVRGMHVYDQHYQIKNSNGDGIAAHGGEDDPISNDDKTMFKTNVCYYEPAMIDCGGVIDLTENAPTATFTSPDSPEMECTWFIKTNENAQIRLQFDSFDIKGTMGDCDDTLKIGYFKPGQTPFTYCGKKLEQTIQSVNKTIIIHLSTYGQSTSSFSATVNLILDKDLCYVAGDRGLSYVGKVNFTRVFEPCIPWAEATKCRYNPYKVMTPKAHTTVLEGNYCRNPDFDTGIMPWCYTNAETCERNYCDPCLIGNKYDHHEKCKEMAELGMCSMPGTGIEAMSHCARTCDIQIPTAPVKAEDVTCPSPPDVNDGAVVDGGDKQSYKVGAKVTYKCKTSLATEERFCLSSGEWSEMGFVCDVCPFGWHLDWSTKSCLKYFDVEMSLSGARQACIETGGSMAAGKNEHMNAVIANIISDNVWMPISDAAEEDKWVWDDNSLANWTNWGDDQPDDWGYGEDCSTVRTNGEWNDVPCSYNYAYVCIMAMFESTGCVDYWDGCQAIFASNPAMCTDDNELAKRMCPYTCGDCNVDSTPQCVVDSAPNVQPDVCSIPRGAMIKYQCDEGYIVSSGDINRGCMADGKLSGDPLVCVKDCPDGWVYFEANKQCYGYFDEPANYETASSRCQEMQGNLAMPVTPVESGKIREAVNSSANIWVGLNDRLKEDVFMWDNGQFLLNWENWDWWQPDNYGSGEDCIYIKSNGKWNDNKCSNEMPYVCQVPVHLVKSKCDVEAPSKYVTSSVQDATVSIGDTVRYSCVGGYIAASGDTTRSCLANGELSGTSLRCTIMRDCPEGWVHSGISQQCYQLQVGLENYDTAASKCEALNGSLATPKTAEENENVMKAINASNYWVWIGMDDKVNEDTFMWIDGTPLDGWTNWATSEPNDYGSGEDCTHLAGSKWNDLPCSKPILYVCQVAMSTFDKDYWNYNPDSSMTYKVFPQSSFSEAKELCESKGATLVIPTNQKENAFLSSLTTKTIWLGITDLAEEGNWTYSLNGDPVVWTNWYPHRPNGNGDYGHTRGGVDQPWDDYVPDRSVWAEATVCQRGNDCYYGSSEKYQGTVSKTVGGLTCQRWDSQTPHSHGYTSPSNFIDNTLPENYCRNAIGEKLKPWCYTSDSDKRWDYCDVRECAGPSRCPSGFESYGNICYRFITEKKSWQSARSRCTEMGAFLAEPRSHEEILAISEIIGKNSKTVTAEVWLGATDRQTESTWQWMTSLEEMDWSAWASGQPNNYGGRQNCLNYWVSGKGWDDEVCSANYNFICQFNVSG